MESLARSLLGKLLDDAYKEEAGRRARAAALTAFNLSAYHDCKSLQGREAFEAVMESARMASAVDFDKADRGPLEGFIVRVLVRNPMVLASFLGREPLNATLTRAKNALDPFVGRFPVLATVLGQWNELRKVRNHDATSVQDWLDAIKVIDFSEENLRKSILTMPLNVASGNLFKDTKRIRRLEIPLDVLLTDSIEVSGREGYELWNDIGLFREEHPVRMAGNVVVEREGVTARLDTPYSGLPAESVKRLASVPSAVITIENQTTFHEEARALHREDALLIYTAGMPNPPWREMYVRILQGLPEGIPVYHWGDIDEGGFRIASVLAKEAAKAECTILPMKMHPQYVPAEHRRPASSKTIERMAYFASQAGWDGIAIEIERAGFTVEQESLG